jgi:hypothetical protein
VRDGQKIGAQAVFPLQCPAVVRRAIRQQALGAKGVERLFHGIERLACAGENPILEERCELGVERTFVPLAPRGISGTQGDDRHAVLCESASLVGAEHCGGPERLDCRDTPGQDTGARDAPGAHHHEDGKDERKFFRQHRHAERDAAE